MVQHGLTGEGMGGNDRWRLERVKGAPPRGRTGFFNPPVFNR
jgi:hypothetical protein